MPCAVARYRLGPFRVESGIAIPELRADESGEANVFIRMGPVPERIDDVVANETRWWASRREYLLCVPDVARFLVRDGREVVIEPAPGSIPGDIRAYLLSPIFSALCHQAGMYALHASSVRAGNSVAAFLGHSGAGKSTLAACLDRRGYTVVSDDICLLDPRAQDPGVTPGQTLVVPVAPSLKLWRSALEHLGARVEDLPQVFSRDDKYRLKISEIDQRLPLAQVFFLEWAGHAADTAISITPVSGVNAVARMMEFTHNDYLMKATGRREENFLLCGRILSHVRAFTLRRPRDFAHIEQVIEQVVDALEPQLNQAG